MGEIEQPSSNPKSHRQYFVDEAGDGVLFNGKGKVLIGQEGCSRYFMLGILDVPNPDALKASLENLRSDLLNDPYFRKIPSMQPNQRKTAFAFYAKDDIPEVRRAVYTLLRQQADLRFFAVVRDKLGVLREVKSYVHKRYHPNLLYDQLVSRLFKDRLHQDAEYTITFATRGSSDRTRALSDALNIARKRFEKKWEIRSEALIHTQPISKCAYRQQITFCGHCSAVTNVVKTAIWIIYGHRTIWFMMLMTIGKINMASTIRRRRHFVWRVCHCLTLTFKASENIGFITESHGMEPNFVL